jgi:hypothetical protein
MSTESKLPAEPLRLAAVIADKIEDGTLFQAGIFSKRELADAVRSIVKHASRDGCPCASDQERHVPRTVISERFTTDLARLLNEARCLSGRIVGNRELAEQIVAFIKERQES